MEEWLVNELSQELTLFWKEGQSTMTQECRQARSVALMGGYHRIPRGTILLTDRNLSHWFG
jgi:hypothetical protein